MRAYATNAAGTGYGDDVMITTAADSAGGWVNMSDKLSLAAVGVQTLKAVSATGGTRVFIAPNDANIKRSDDGGATFSTVATAKTSQNLFVFAGGATVYGVGPSARGRKSTDGGLTWAEYYGVGSAVNNYAVSFATTDVGYCGGYGGKLVKTENGGVTWTAKASPLGSSSFSDVLFPDSDNPLCGADRRIPVLFPPGGGERCDRHSRDQGR